MNYTVTDNNYDRLVKKPSVNSEQVVNKKPWELFGVSEMTAPEMQSIIAAAEARQD